MPPPVSGGSGCPLAYGFITPVSASVVTLLPPLLCVYRTRTFVTRFRNCSDNPRLYPHVEIFNLSTSVKTHFPNKVIVTGFRDWDVHIFFGVCVGGHFFFFFFAYCTVEGERCSNLSFTFKAMAWHASAPWLLNFFICMVDPQIFMGTHALATFSSSSSQHQGVGHCPVEGVWGTLQQHPLHCP